MTKVDEVVSIRIRPGSLPDPEEGAEAMAAASSAGHNPRPPELQSLQIRTKSIEQTLIPLVTQVLYHSLIFLFLFPFVFLVT